MFNDLINQFMGSQHANDAMQQLQKQQGMSPDQARDAVSAAAEAAQQHAQSGDGDPAQKFGTFGNAAVGGIGGMLGGGGVRGAVEGGIGSVIAGRAAEIVAQRTGMNPNTASSVAAVAMPFVMRYIQQHLGQAGAGGAPQQQQQQQSMPNGKPGMAPNAKDAAQDGGAMNGGDVPPWKRGL